MSEVTITIHRTLSETGIGGIHRVVQDRLGLGMAEAARVVLNSLSAIRTATDAGNEITIRYRKDGYEVVRKVAKS